MTGTEVTDDMTGEEMERAIEFLLKNQAAFDAKFEVEREKTNQQIRDLAAGHQQTREFLDEITEIVAQNAQQIAQNSRDIAQNSRDIAQNSRDIAQNSQQSRHINEVLLNVAEGQNRNREEIDVLVKLVGGVIEGGNGKSQR